MDLINRLVELVSTYLRECVLNPALIPYSVFDFVFGYVPIAVYLFVTHHASLERSKSDFSKPFDIRCADIDWEKDLPVLGGSSAFSFGVTSWLLSLLATNQGWSFGAHWFAGNAQMRFFLTFANLTYFIVRLYIHRKDVKKHIPRWGWFTAHIFGCGHATARGPFFFLFWMQWLAKKLKYYLLASIIVVLRDIETAIGFVFSLPTMPFMNILTFPIIGKVLIYRLSFAKRPAKKR